LSNPNTSEKSTDLNRQENQTKGNVSAKKVSLYTYNSGTDTLSPLANALVAGVDFDYLDVQQTSATVETYVFKLGGSGGTVKRTVVVTYVLSDKADIDYVTWS